MRNFNIGQFIFSSGRIVALRNGFVLGVFLTAPTAQAASSSGNSKYRFDMHLANSFQNFAGVTGANFSSIDRLSYSSALFYRFKKYFDVGFQFALIPSIALTPFTFSDNIVGSYAAKFYQYELLLGFVKSKYRFHIVTGYEHLALVGSPELTRGMDLKFYYGAQFSVDIFKRHKIRIPLFLKLLKKAARLYEFTNKPADPLTVSAGYEIVLGTGADFEFK